MFSSHLNPQTPLAPFSRRVEIASALLLLSALAVLHAIYAFVFRLDSDEPQHLHVVWGWTQGALLYRDFFDNHSPLFSGLCAPLLAVLGERADIVPWMRLAMIPVGALCLCGLYWLGRRLFDSRTGLWAAVIAGYWPTFFYTSVEFRPDTLWTAFWLLSLAVLLTGPPTSRRLFFFGIIFGLAFATSMKTILLAGTLALTVGLVIVADWRQFGVPPPPWWLARGTAILFGLTLVLGSFVALFVVQGAWKPLCYCLVSHNILPGLVQDQGWLRWRPLLFPLCLPGLFVAARALLLRPRRLADPWRVQRTVFVLTTCAYPVLLVSFWPLLTMQDYLPAIPPLVLLIVAAGFAPLRRRGNPQEKGLPGPAADPWLETMLVATLVASEITAIFCVHGPWQNHTGRQREMLSTIKRLTAPGDPVMDDKGETIFRQRPFYFALEGITLERLRRGLIADDIAARLIATQTAVVHARHLPPQAHAFVGANYLPIGRLAVSGNALEPVELGRFSVLGKVVPPVAQDPSSASRQSYFQIEVPAHYVVLDMMGELAFGQLDGQPPGDEGRWLSAGVHGFAARAGGPLVVFWADAWKKGFRPLLVSDSLAAVHGQFTPLHQGRPPVDPGPASR